MAIPHWQTHDGSSTAWKEIQTFVREQDDLDVEVSMEHKTWWMAVPSSRPPFSPALKISSHQTTYLGELVLFVFNIFFRALFSFITL